MTTVGVKGLNAVCNLVYLSMTEKKIIFAITKAGKTKTENKPGILSD